MKNSRKFSTILAIVFVFTIVFSSITWADSIYVVKKGDALWKIAKQNDMDWKDLSHYNNLENPDLIFPGQEIKIPDSNGKIQDKDQEKEEVNEVIKSDESTLTLLHTNDMHGFFVEGKYDGMGVAKLTTKVDQIRNNNKNVLLLDAGDATQGNNFATLSKGENAIKVMNHMGYDAMTAGNHEFDYGSDRLLELNDMAEFPILVANIVKEDGSEFLNSPKYIIKEMDGVKVGIFGLGTPETKYKSHPKNTEGLTFKDESEVASEIVAELEGKVDVIVALAHLGVEGQDTSKNLAQEVSGIDVIIDGHSHTELPEGMLVNDTLIVQASEKTKDLGIVNIVLKDGKIVSKKASLFTKEQAAEIEEDAEIKSIVEKLKKVNEKIESQVVAKSPMVLDGEREQVRAGETNLGNLITAALLDISGADIALTNGGGIRTSIDEGDVTKGEVLEVLPFGNTVAVIEVTGAEVIEAIENGIDSYPEAKGAFPHIAGMTVEFDSTKEAGSRVVSIKVAGKEIDKSAKYKLVTNDYLAAGGDGYSMFSDNEIIAEYSAMDEVLIDYLNENGFDAGEITNRIKDISQEATSAVEAIELDVAA